jgi:hypothetical protein
MRLVDGSRPRIERPRSDVTGSFIACACGYQYTCYLHTAPAECVYLTGVLGEGEPCD